MVVRSAVLVPLGVLTLGAVFAGFVFTGFFIDAEKGAEFWAGSIAFNAHLMEEMHHVPLLVKLAARIASQTEQKQHTDSEASNKTD